MVKRHLSKEQIKTIEDSVRNILSALGEDPDREGLIETPGRVARMYDEVFEGIRYTNEEIAKMFDKCFEESASSDMVMMKDITIFSHCEHHIALMYNMKVAVAYLPQGKVIGLSKIARICDMVGKRLQLQERITKDIYDILSKILCTEDIFVLVEGEHSCLTARGIEKPGTMTVTRQCGGLFSKHASLRAEFYAQLNEKLEDKEEF